jgi:hypothetical protein
MAAPSEKTIRPSHVVASGQGRLYRKRRDRKSLSKRLIAPGAYIFDCPVGGVASFYSPDRATALLLDDLKSRSAELDSLVEGLPLSKRANLLHREPIEEAYAILRRNGLKTSRREVALRLYGQKGYGEGCGGLIAGYSYLLSGLRLSINGPEDILSGRLLVNGGLSLSSLPPLTDRSALEETFAVLKKDKLDPFAKIALLHFFYLRAGLYGHAAERFLYLLLTVLVFDSYSKPFAFTLARRLSKAEKAIARDSVRMDSPHDRGDLDRFVYRYAKRLSRFLDEEILSLRRGVLRIKNRK